MCRKDEKYFTSMYPLHKNMRRAVEYLEALTASLERRCGPTYYFSCFLLILLIMSSSCFILLLQCHYFYICFLLLFLTSAPDCFTHITPASHSCFLPGTRSRKQPK